MAALGLLLAAPAALAAAGDGITDLGTLGGDRSEAYGVSADGSVVVGFSYDATGNPRAFRWTRATGMQSVEDWLRDHGVTVPADVTREARAVSADGSVVVGQLDNGHAFLARVGGAGNGLTTIDGLTRSLADTARGLDGALAAARLQIEGAHGRPLARRVAAGRSVFWAAGDWGRDTHGARDGSLGLAEVGWGRNLGRAQVNLAAGRTRARQALDLGGRALTTGTYVLAEALVPLRPGLVATAGAYWHRGRARLRRAYLNAGAVDASYARPAVRTWGARVRLDWTQALRHGATAWSPYADLLHASARMDGYTETGGGFPARFDARRERDTELRLGMTGERALGSGARLLLTVEAAHRFQGRGARTSGEVLGLSRFDLDGQRLRRSWLRAGLGVEGRVGRGTGSITVHATTRGPMPRYWLAADWRMPL